jgi:5-methylcytosine-specific restriction endonuclease McrA
VADWREKNRERHRQLARDWYAANADQARAKKLAEYHSDPAPFVARNMVRKARRLAAVCEHGPGCVSAEFIAWTYEQACLYCGKPAEHADHYQPLARGGLHCRDNIVPACQPCNHSKWAHDPDEWLAARTP